MYKCIKVREIDSALCWLPSVPGQCNEQKNKNENKIDKKKRAAVSFSAQVLLRAGPRVWNDPGSEMTQVPKMTRDLSAVHTAARQNLALSAASYGSSSSDSLKTFLTNARVRTANMSPPACRRRCPLPTLLHRCTYMLSVLYVWI